MESKLGDDPGIYISAADLNILTHIIRFDGKDYFPDDKIPYPTSEPKTMRDFQVSMIWEQENAFDEIDYDEIYEGKEELWTDIITKFSVNKNMDELGIVAQYFVKDFIVFLENLEKDGQAVYHNEEYSPFKWLAWIKDDKVRLIHQDYRFNNVKTEFDVLVDKDWFFHFGQYMIKTMQEYADSDLKRYNKYVKEKYNK